MKSNPQLFKNNLDENTRNYEKCRENERKIHKDRYTFEGQLKDYEKFIYEMRSASEIWSKRLRIYGNYWDWVDIWWDKLWSSFIQLRILWNKIFDLRSILITSIFRQALLIILKCCILPIFITGKVRKKSM